MFAHSAILAIILFQLCPTRGRHAAQSKVLCGPIYVSGAVKVSYILITRVAESEAKYPTPILQPVRNFRLRLLNIKRMKFGC